MIFKKQPIYYASLGLLFFILDRTLKYLFHTSILNDSLLFTYTMNSGIAFGLPLPNTFFIPLIFIILVFLIFYFIKSYQEEKYFTFFSLWLIILGASSNIIDRIKYTSVIDYLDLHYWPVFNIADMMIVAGVFILAYLHFRKDKSIIN